MLETTMDNPCYSRIVSPEFTSDLNDGDVLKSKNIVKTDMLAGDCEVVQTGQDLSFNKSVSADEDLSFNKSVSADEDLSFNKSVSADEDLSFNKSVSADEDLSFNNSVSADEDLNKVSLNVTGSVFIGEKLVEETHYNYTKHKVQNIQSTLVLPDFYSQIIEQSLAEITHDEKSFDASKHREEFADAIDRLETNNVLLITGPTRCGKSAFARALLRHFYTRDYTPMVPHSFKEWRKYAGGKGKMVVLLENVFGVEKLHIDNYGVWSSVLPIMRKQCEDSQCLTIITARCSVVWEMRDRRLLEDVSKYVFCIDLGSAHEQALPPSRHVTAPPELKRVQNYVSVTPDEYDCADRGKFQEAVTALATNNVLFIIGPPGSGKSSLGCALLKYFCEEDCISLPPESNKKRRVSKGEKSKSVAFLDEFFGNGTLGQDLLSRKISVLKHLANDTCLLITVLSEVIKEVKDRIQACSGLKNAYFLELRKNHLLDTTKTKVSTNRMEVMDTNEHGSACPRPKAITSQTPPIPRLRGDKLLFKERENNYEPDMEIRFENEMCESEYSKYERISCPCSGDVSHVGWTPLHTACHSGNYMQMRRLLDEGVNVNAQANCGETPLHIACLHGHSHIAQELLDSGANINVIDKDGWTPLHITCHYGHLETVRTLLERSAETNVRSYKGETPLYMASLNCHTAVVSFLLNRGALTDVVDDDGWTPLHISSYLGQVGVLQKLLHRGASTKIKTNSGKTPLSVACNNGHGTVVQILLNSGACPNSADNNGWSPLHMASCNGHLDVVHTLLEHGAKMEEKNNEGATPFYIACENGHCELVKSMLGIGTNLNAKNCKGMPSLYIACQKNHEDVVRQLLDKGAEVNAKTKTGATALHVTCQNGNIKLVQLLLEARAVIDTCDRYGWTPLHTACKNGHIRTVRFLLKSGANMDVQTHTGLTPLHVSCENGHSNIVRVLVDSGARIDVTDNFGENMYTLLASLVGGKL